MFSTHIRVGRLYEHRILSIESEAELQALGDRAREVMTSIVAKKVVCADYRKVRVLKPEFTTTWVERIRQMNPNVERSAVLVTPNHATFGLQMERMVKDSAHPLRRVFSDVEACRLWLGEVLNGEERARLAAFLNEGHI